MTDESNPELSADLIALLGDDAVWAEVEPEITDRAIAAVMDEVGRSGSTMASGATPADETRSAPSVVDLNARRRFQWSSAILGAAAALFVAVAGFVVVTSLANGESDSDISVALAATDREPDAAGTVELTAVADGTRIVIETTGLPPAPEGTYYEAWLRTGPDFGVSAGTFHLRGGGGVPIELWAGVSIEDFPLFTVTLQPIGMEESSGEVVLAARLDN